MDIQSYKYMQFFVLAGHTDLEVITLKYSDLDDRVVVPVIIDTEAPKLYTDEIAYLYNPYTDGRRLEFYVSDNYDIAAVVPMTEAGVAYEYIPVDVKPGEKTLVSIDVSKYDAPGELVLTAEGEGKPSF